MGNDAFNLLVAGVGGQGNLVCSRVVAEAALRDGLRPVVGQTFGASRRGGTVFTHIRLSENHLVGPLIPSGQLDLVLGLEPLETLRAVVQFGGQRTEAIVCPRIVETLDTLSGIRRYPDLDEMRHALKDLCRRVLWLDGKECLRTGARRLNALMLGVLASWDRSPVSEASIRAGVETMPGDRKMNLQAFERGLALRRAVLGTSTE